MKRFLILLLLPLLLAGCSKPKQPTDSTPPTTQALPVEPGLYDPDSTIEKKTGGAVKCYPLEDDTYDILTLVGDDLLLQGRNNTRLTLLTGINLTPAVEKDIPFHPEHIQANSRGIAYLDSKNRTVIFLNTALREVSRLQMPEDLTGQVWLTPEWDALFYGTASGIRSMDLKTGISRLVMQQAQEQSVTGVFLDGSVIRCQIQTSDRLITRLLASNNGEILWEGDQLLDLFSAGENWFACVDRGTVQELLFGQGGQIRNFWPDDTSVSILPLPERNAVITCQEASWGCRVNYYDLITGKRTSSVRLSGIHDIQSVCQDISGNGIWLLAGDTGRSTDVILHWAIHASSTGDTADYTDTHYTRENPDTQGLQDVQETLQTWQNRYGVELLIGESAATLAEDRAESEYLVQAFAQHIPVIKKALSNFPADLLKTAAQRSPSGLIHIGLVRSIQPETAAMPVLQFWKDGEFYLVLAMNDRLEQSLYHGIYHLLETRILSASTAFYDWDKLNPADFSYDLSFDRYTQHQSSPYLKGTSRAFVDAFSMTYASEDRARIMEYACMPENEALFRSDSMQQKLKTLCRGIRETFSIESGTLIWEQYVKEEP